MEKKQGHFWLHFLEVVLNIAIIGAIVLGIRTFLVSPFRVDGDSMLDTLENNQYIIINKLAYHIGEPERGDVVVLRPPTDPDKYYVKRVIGVPGDEVILREGFVFVNRDGDEYKLPEEDYLNKSNYGNTFCHFCGSDEQRYLVPDEHFFVLGDNRLGSQDSRVFRNKKDPAPYIPENYIKGKVWLVVFPITKFHIIEPVVNALSQ